MTLAIDGLVSGLNTTQIIQSLMSVGQAQQNNLRTSVSVYGNQQKAWNDIGAKFGAMATAGSALLDSSLWGSSAATTSSDAVTVAAAPNAVSSQLQVNVERLARNEVYSSIGGVALTANATSSVPPSITLNISGTATTLAPTTGSLSDVINSINAANIGVRAYAISTGTGTYALQVAGTGADKTAISVTGLDGFTGGFRTQQTAQTAQLSVGDIADPNRFIVTSNSNTFADLSPGLTVTAARVQNGITVGVAADPGKIADKMQAMVDAANATIAAVNTAAANSPTGVSGALAGDSSTRALNDKIRQMVSGGSDGGGTFSKVGVQLTTDGKFTFDRAAFLTSYAADPTGTQKMITATDPALGADATRNSSISGLAERLRILSSITTGTGGIVASATASITSSVTTLNAQIDDWDIRLADKKTTLTRQFANLETSLGKLKSQSSWLAGQIAGLNRGY